MSTFRTLYPNFAVVEALAGKSWYGGVVPDTCDHVLLKDVGIEEIEAALIEVLSMPRNEVTFDDGHIVTVSE